MKEFNLFSPRLALYDRKHFRSISTSLINFSHSKQPSFFYQKFPLLSSDLKNLLIKHFSEMQLFANVLQNRCSSKFSNIHVTISLLESLLNEITGLMACNFIKKETPTLVFFCKYHKMFEKSFFYGTPPVAASENGWRISKNF